MAIRTWGRVLLAALGVAMLAAASQLGVAFGLGIVRLSRTFPVDQENQWTAQMAWVAWFAMVAAVAGAIAADRMARRKGYEGGTGSRIAYSLAGGIGAAVLVPLCMQPARFAIVRSTDPVLVIGLSAALGAVAGVFLALAALTYQPLMWNVGAVTGGAWALALISVIPSLGPDDPLPNVRLGVLDLASFSSSAAQSVAVVTMPLLALAVGAATAGIGRWLGRPPVTIAASGIVGPAMLCLAYLIAGPGTDTDKFQAAPYWGALVAVGAGTLGSVLATFVRKPTPRPEAPTPRPEAPTAEPGAATAGEQPGPRIDPVFREAPTGEWTVSLPRHSADTSPAPAGSGGGATPGGRVPSSAGSTPAGGFESGSGSSTGGGFASGSGAPAGGAFAPGSGSTSGGGFAAGSGSAGDETTTSLPTVDPPGGRGSFSAAPEPTRDGGLFDETTADLAPQSPPPPARPPRRSPGPRDPGAAEAATAFSAGRRAAGYSTGELPIYTDAAEPPGRGRDATTDEPAGRGRRAATDEPPRRGRDATTDEPAGRPRGGAQDDKPGRRGRGNAAPEPGGRKGRKRAKDEPAATEEAPARQRRGLFGRRRAAPEPEATEPAGKLDVPTQRGGQTRPEPPLKPRDEEYVDWVSGLSNDADPRDPAR